MATRLPPPADLRPSYRPGHPPPCELPQEDMLTITPWIGGEEEQTWRQVGWLGASGTMYGLDEQPREFEQQDFRPMWILVQ